jgi:hypothetical protein
MIGAARNRTVKYYPAMAKRYAAIHTARRLIALRILIQRYHEFIEIFESFLGGNPFRALPVIFKKSSRFSHYVLHISGEWTFAFRFRSYRFLSISYKSQKTRFTRAFL